MELQASDHTVKHRPRHRQMGFMDRLPYLGWLQSALPYEPTTLNLKTSVQTMPIGERPNIIVELSDHPLSIEQHHGITMARVQQIAEACLHG